MTEKASRLAVLGGVVVLWLLSSFQGARIGEMRQTEKFYRWVLTAATFAGFGETLEPDRDADSAEPMDDELFAKLIALAEEELSETPIEQADYNDDGSTKASLLRATRQGNDRAIYDLLTTEEGAALQDEFFKHLKAGLLQSAGTQFAASSLYDEGSQVDVGLTSLFFGFRQVASNFLWLQVDKYWHTGQMHRMIPMMRTTVTLDPNFIDAYLLGAWHLAYNITAQLPETPEPQKVFSEKYNMRLGIKEEWYFAAAEFLRDGIRKNPREYRLYFDLGYGIYDTKLKDYDNAALYLDEARRYPHDQWVPRMLYRAFWLSGQHDKAIAGWENYLESFPGMYQATRFLQVNKGYLAEVRAEQAYECHEAALLARERFVAQAEEARAQGNAQAAVDLESQARIAADVAREMNELSEAEWENARQVWLPMIQADQDSIATARMLRQTAMRHVEEKRYIEAVSELDLARYEMLQSFDEFSDLMIEIKQKGGLPLTVSEQLAVERRREAALYQTAEETERPRFVECDYLDVAAEVAAAD